MNQESRCWTCYDRPATHYWAIFGEDGVVCSANGRGYMVGLCDTCDKGEEYDSESGERLLVIRASLSSCTPEGKAIRCANCKQAPIGATCYHFCSNSDHYSPEQKRKDEAATGYWFRSWNWGKIEDRK